MTLIDPNPLWEKAKQLEDEAMEELEKCTPGTNEWWKWLATLNERTSFRFDIQDEPTVEAITADTATILGYPVKDLRILAEAMRRQNVSTDDVREFVTTLENALKVVQASYKVTFDEATKVWSGTYEEPGNMAGLYKMMQEAE